jgi:hypothetical protein
VWSLSIRYTAGVLIFLFAVPNSSSKVITAIMIADGIICHGIYQSSSSSWVVVCLMLWLQRLLCVKMDAFCCCLIIGLSFFQWSYLADWTMSECHPLKACRFQGCFGSTLSAVDLDQINSGSFSNGNANLCNRLLLGTCLDPFHTLLYRSGCPQST